MSNIKSYFWLPKSENIGGALYFAGNAFFFAPSLDRAGTTAGMIGMASCTIGMFFGDKSWGYSSAQLLGAMSAVAMVISNVTNDNLALQFIFSAQILVQTLASLRYPAQLLRPYVSPKPAFFLEVYENNIRAIVGSSLILLKAPAILSAGFAYAIHSQNGEMLAANLTWATGDVFFNRLYQHPVIRKGLHKLGLS